MNSRLNISFGNCIDIGNYTDSVYSQNNKKLEQDLVVMLMVTYCRFNQLIQMHNGDMTNHSKTIKYDH